MIKNGKEIYYPIKKKELCHWTDYYFDEYIARDRFGTRTKIN